MKATATTPSAPVTCDESDSVEAVANEGSATSPVAESGSGSKRKR